MTSSTSSECSENSAPLTHTHTAPSIVPTSDDGLVFVAPHSGFSVRVSEEFKKRLDCKYEGMPPEEVKVRAKVYEACLLMQEYEIEQIVCPALGWEEDPEYGYPTGEMIAMDLVFLLAARYKSVRGVE